MSVITEPNYKKRVATPDDSVYLLELRAGLFCPFCMHPGIKKKYANLWRLACHFSTHHELEHYREIIITIASLIKRGILK